MRTWKWVHFSMANMGHLFLKFNSNSWVNEFSRKQSIFVKYGPIRDTFRDSLCTWNASVNAGLDNRIQTVVAALNDWCCAATCLSLEAWSCDPKVCFGSHLQIPLAVKLLRRFWKVAVLHICAGFYVHGCVLLDLAGKEKLQKSCKTDRSCSSVCNCGISWKSNSMNYSVKLYKWNGHAPDARGQQRGPSASQYNVNALQCVKLKVRSLKLL
jgi:hypothetical protein